jgi:hypothetical protein
MLLIKTIIAVRHLYVEEIIDVSQRDFNILKLTLTIFADFLPHHSRITLNNHIFCGAGAWIYFELKIKKIPSLKLKKAYDTALC